MMKKISVLCLFLLLFDLSLAVKLEASILYSEDKWMKLSNLFRNVYCVQYEYIFRPCKFVPAQQDC